MKPVTPQCPMRDFSHKRDISPHLNLAATACIVVSAGVIRSEESKKFYELQSHTLITEIPTEFMLWVGKALLPWRAISHQQTTLAV